MVAKRLFFSIFLLCSTVIVAQSAVRAEAAEPGWYPLVAESPRSDLPPILSAEDEALYQRIFALGQLGNWSEADALLARVENPILVGHVLSQRYLHPTFSRAQTEELIRWLEAYADQPEAGRIRSLLQAKTKKRGKRPLPLDPPVESVGEIEEPTSLTIAMSEADDESDEVIDSLQLAGEIRALLETGASASALHLLRSPRAQRLLSGENYAQLQSDILQLEAEGGDCGVQLGECAQRSDSRAVDAAWWQGLDAWRNGNFEAATRQFEMVATGAIRSPWLASAGAFWAARGHLHAREPQSVNKWLTAAAAYPRTFYGLLARRIVGLPMPFNWRLTEEDRAAVARLQGTAAGRRALALIQIAEKGRAASELASLATIRDTDLLHGVMVAADRSGAANLALQLEQRLRTAGQFDSAAFPIPRWQPEGGFQTDRALIYALIRQESQFNPRAVSRAGARGVMQLMPGTAHFVARTMGYFKDAGRLAKPEVNMALGQAYIERLLSDSSIGGDLFRLAAAWNGGPGNLERWQRGAAATDDPLLFIESIPARETRDFIERVLANLWIYRDRLGQSDPSLDALAAGEWPAYVALDSNLRQVANREPD